MYAKYKKQPSGVMKGDLSRLLSFSLFCITCCPPPYCDKQLSFLPPSLHQLGMFPSIPSLLCQHTNIFYSTTFISMFLRLLIFLVRRPGFFKCFFSFIQILFRSSHAVINFNWILISALLIYNSLSTVIQSKL